MLPKLVITDIDGVWTDGGMYYDQTGNEWKRFNTSDSVGVLFLQLLEIPCAIVTGENTEIVKRRAEKLKIKELYMGCKNKLQTVTEICNRMNISLNECAFVGDDINDILLLRACGISAVPNQTADYVAENAQFRLSKKGGEGVFREFVEKILKENQLLEVALAKYLDSIK